LSVRAQRCQSHYFSTTPLMLEPVVVSEKVESGVVESYLYTFMTKARTPDGLF